MHVRCTSCTLFHQSRGGGGIAQGVQQYVRKVREEGDSELANTDVNIAQFKLLKKLNAFDRFVRPQGYTKCFDEKH